MLRWLAINGRIAIISWKGVSFASERDSNTLAITGDLGCKVSTKSMSGAIAIGTQGLELAPITSTEYGSVRILANSPKFCVAGAPRFRTTFDCLSLAVEMYGRSVFDDLVTHGAAIKVKLEFGVDACGCLGIAARAA